MSTMIEMNVFWNAVLGLVFVLSPAFVIRFCRKCTWAGKIGPVLILYILGIIIGNMGLVPGISLPEGAASLQDLLSSAMVPVAIPLMLLGCTFRKSETRSQLLAMLTGFAAVVLAVMAGYLLFSQGIDSSAHGSDTAANVGGMLTGVYTGGTINLASLKTMLGVSEETYLLLNGYDMVVSFLYLVFLVSIGVKIFRSILPVETQCGDELPEPGMNPQADPYAGLFSRRGFGVILRLVLVVAVICGLSFAVTLLFPKVPFMTLFILSLTTLSIAASFIPSVRNLPYAYDIGMYCIYVFCIVVASMADFSKINLAGGVGMLGYLVLVIFGSLFLQLLFARVFKIDADTVVTCSVAFICSPPFVPIIAAAMKNRRVLVSGLSIGIIGYAVGNYLGFLMSRLLLLL